jgi:hypothetical protein
MTARRATAVLVVAAVLGTAGCSATEIEPDAIGLHYTSGSFDGKAFAGVVRPGEVEWTWNDDVHRLTTAQRSFIVRRDQKADVDGVISVPAGGDADTNGMLVDFEISVAFKTNTRDDDVPGYEGGTLRKFFEDLCKHYECQLDPDGNEPEGWRKLLREKFYPQLESAFKDEARKYHGDAIVNNVQVADTDTGTLTLLQADVGKRFQEYLERQTGKQFFCGPSFDREVPGDPNAKDARLLPCPPVELLIIGADYNDPEIRKGRSAKKVAIDQSAAQAQLSKSLSDPNYLEYLRIEASKECARSNQAVCVFSSGAVNPSLTLPPR